MKLKKLIYRLTYKNFRANYGMLIALILFLIFFAFKCHGHIELHGDFNAEMIEMARHEKEQRERLSEVEKKYEVRKENIKEWFEEDDYCDKDLRDQVLKKTKEEEKEAKERAKSGYTIG